MDWARRIVVSGRELCAEVVAPDGHATLMALPELARHGVPAARATVRKQVELKFEDFSPCTADEYLAHFGIEPTPDAEGFQLMFKVVVGETRYLVPALVLMRALFRPTSHLLHQIFGPNVLDRNCRLDFADEELRVVVDAPWAGFASTERRGDCEGPLRWMLLHPSARRMADSVHQYAMSGIIALDLPDGDSEVVFAGVKGAAAVLVTEARVLSVTPSDRSDIPGAEAVPRVDFVDRSWAEGRDIAECISADVPLHADGTHELTDKEWAIVGPVLEGERKRTPSYQHCPRSLLDGVLGKLASGKSWRESPYKVGDWRNAATTYRRWNARGTFAEAMQALREAR